MIRKALELLSRPVRRRRWNARRALIARTHEPLDVNHNPLADDGEHSCYSGPTIPIPCAWEERDPAEVRQDVHRFVERLKIRLKKSQNLLIDPKTGRVVSHDIESDLVDLGDGSMARYSEIMAFLKRAKKDLKKKKFVGVEHPPGWVNPLTNDEDSSVLDMNYHSLSTDEE